MTLLMSLLLSGEYLIARYTISLPTTVVTLSRPLSLFKAVQPLPKVKVKQLEEKGYKNRALRKIAILKMTGRNQRRSQRRSHKRRNRRCHRRSNSYKLQISL